MIGEQLDWNNENDADEMQVSERGMFTESDEKRKKKNCMWTRMKNKKK